MHPVSAAVQAKTARPKNKNAIVESDGQADPKIAGCNKQPVRQTQVKQ